MTGVGKNHYMSNAEITRSIVEGTPATALCGDTFRPTSQGSNALPGSPVANRKMTMCEACELLYHAMWPAHEHHEQPTDFSGATL